jgi:endonuclease YncB( thermonuclease family)
LPPRYCLGFACAFAAALTAVAAAAQDRAPDCALEAIGTASANVVLDGRTVRLADGRELRLAGIETPQPSEHAASALAARSALETLVTGRELALKRLGPDSDRHGRIVAHVFIAAGPGAGTWIQQVLLAQGHGRMAARIGSKACAGALLAAEKAARIAGLGLWGNPHYVMRRAETPAEVLAERGRFSVVEGKVLSVRESGGTIYVNFGRRWSEDFTVTVLKRSERAFAAAGLELRNLAGRTVRVRGTVEERGGPRIEAMRPEQIEIAERD